LDDGGNDGVCGVLGLVERDVRVRLDGEVVNSVKLDLGHEYRKSGAVAEALAVQTQLRGRVVRIDI
jgi:hypothetical protein